MKIKRIQKKICRGIRGRCICLLAALLLMLSISVQAAARADLTIVVDGDRAVEFRVARVEIPGIDAPEMKALMAEMAMAVKVDGREVFRGSCDALPEPLFGWQPLTDRHDMLIDVEMTFDKWADNRHQGIPYEMIWHFASQDDNGHEIRMEKKEIHNNPNVNPGDVWGYQILVKTTGNSVPPTQPRNSDDPNNPYNPYNPYNPNNPNYPPIKTGGVFERAATEHLDVLLCVLSLLVLGCILLVLFGPVKKYRRKRAQNR